MVIPLLDLCLILIFCVWTRRIFWMRGLAKSNPPLSPYTYAPSESQPKVSIIVPARDEEKNIARCLHSLFKQSYKNFEILVADDRSSDRTPHLLENFSKLSPVPFKVLRIEKLPPSWTGKNHAQHVASKAATGEWLLFTDADTTHQAWCVATAVKTAVERQIHFLTLAPETEAHTFWEKTVQPLAVSSIALWFSHEKLANGQFLLIKKDAYEKVGGNESVKTEVVEDVALAKKFRDAGFLVKFLNGTRLYSTRMYTGLRQIKTGWTRILTYLFEKNILSILHKMFLFLFFSLFPFVVLAIEKYFYYFDRAHFDSTVFLLSALGSAWIVLIRFVGNKMVRTNPWYAFLHPLGSLVMLWILASCLGRVFFRRPSVWRGDLHR